jgi:hypothetical protein
MPEKTVKYYHIPMQRKVVATTQRAASASMVESLKPHDNGGSHRVEPDRVLELKRQGMHVIMWIRDPFDRLACSYHVFGKRFENLHEWVDHVCTNKNPHWTPQTVLHNYPGHGFLPTRVYSFEDLSKTWTKEFPDHPLQHVGLNPDRLSWTHLKNSMSNMDLAKLYEHFENDLVMCSKARQRDCWVPGMEEVA